MSVTIAIEGQEAAPIRAAGPIVTIGRVPGNDVVVPDARISSRHGRLVRRGEGYAYEDLGSRNGSLVERNGERAVVRTHSPVKVGRGDRLLLGDLVSPVVLRIVDAPQGAGGEYTGGTVVARRSVADVDTTLERADDPRVLRELFRLLHDLSGRVDPDEVLRRITEAVLARFPHACSATVLLRDAKGEWAPEHTRSRDPAAGTAQPSGTLLQRALESREVVAYIPGTEAAPASVAGLAGTVLVPLLAGDEAIGVLHVDSRRAAFGQDDLAWLAIVGTHVAASLVTARRFHALARAAADLEARNESLERAARMPRPILGRSRALEKALRQLERVARTETLVLILGETGTGKELAARYVHAQSSRVDRIFAPLNCGALPEDLLNSELFGHKKGAFTGALADRKGLFEAAEGGTVFLDEIGEVSPAVQVRLLRVLQEREVQPIGAQRPIKVDVRIVAATNRDLKADVDAGRFREDLYYRLSIFPVVLPPLREREGDVELLAERFREAICARNDKWVPGFTPEAMSALQRHAWPGNVRQLEHEIERAVILADEGALIGLDELSPAVAGAQRPSRGAELELPTGQLKDVMADLEERVIRRCLDEHGGNRTRAADALGISRQALQVKLAKWRTRED